MKDRQSAHQPSDEQLDALLRSMSAADGGNTDEPKPPVINIYRLERERERRQSDWQLKITAAAASISVLLTTVITAAVLNHLSAHSAQIMSIPAVAKMYFSFKYFSLVYGREIGVIATVFLALAVSGYLLCAVLLVKNKDKILEFRKNE